MAFLLSGVRILLVEDDDLVALTLSMLLESEGTVLVGPFDSAPLAVAALGTLPVHGALLDINIRGGNSFPVAEALQRQGIPYAFLSGEPPDCVPDHLRPRRFLQKPAETRAVLQVVAGFLTPAH